MFDIQGWSFARVAGVAVAWILLLWLVMVARAAFAWWQARRAVVGDEPSFFSTSAHVPGWLLFGPPALVVGLWLLAQLLSRPAA